MTLVKEKLAEYILDVATKQADRSGNQMFKETMIEVTS